MKNILLLLVSILVLGLQPFYSAAEEIEEPEVPWKKFSFTAGGFFNGINSSLRYGLRGVGVEVNMEEALGLDSSIFVFKTDAAWRFTNNLRHRVDVGWFATNRNSSKVLEEDVTFRDIVYPAGTKAESKLNFDIIKGTYSYSYFQDNRFDLSASFGFYVMPISFEVNSDVGEIKQSDNLTAPLPVFGLRNTFAITPEVFIKNSVDIFYLEVDNFRGGVTDIQLAAEYSAFEHVGFGLGVESFRLKIKSERSSNYPGVDFDGKITMNYVGAIFYINTYF